MKSIKFLSLLCLLTFAGINFPSCHTVSEKKTDAKTEITQTIIKEKLTVDAFQSKLITTQNYQLIDVRTPEEYAEGYIEGAKNINFHAADFASRLDNLNKELPIFIYCGVGGRSGKTATILGEKGFVEIYDLNGGYTEWINSNMPVNK